jgi:hemoglobin
VTDLKEEAMITEYIRYRIDPDIAPNFEAAYVAAAESLDTSPHCVDYELARSHEEPDRYILRIRWDSLDGHLTGFRSSAHFRAFFSHVAPYVAAIEEMHHYETTAVIGVGAASAKPPSLYEWAGGAAAIEALFVRFYELVAGDPLLQPVFATMNPHHAHHVASWIGEVFGGPANYSAHHGGHPAMLTHHIDKQINEAQRRRWIDLLVDAADDVGLPDDAEFRASFMGYIEWGTRLAKLFSQPGANPNLHEPVPLWDWARPPWQPAASPDA